MTEQRSKRRLAAILAADVTGYSRLMSVDEAGTLARFNALKTEIIEPKIAQYGGAVVGSAGDSLLVEFSSAVDAVQCAVELQTRIAERNADEPEDRRIALRMGINLSDVIADGETIHGDGVNVAARLEKLAETGSVAIAQAVFDQVKGKLALEFTYLGEQRFKNIAEPVHAYRVVTPPFLDRPPAPVQATEPGLSLPSKPSIAVLPFTNMSGDAEQEHFADGIAEDIITELSRFTSLFIIARNSSFTYKGQAVKVQNVGLELGVQYVVEGSVRKAGNRVRVTAQLVEAATGSHLWAERYDRVLEDIFEVQDEITRTIVAAVEPELAAHQREHVVRKPTDSLDAWETYQRGLWHMWHYDEADSPDAIRLLSRATRIDPAFASAYAYLAYAHYQTVIMGWAAGPDESLAAGFAAARKALELDPKDAIAYFALARIHMMRGELDDSIELLEASIRLNPSFAQSYHGLGMSLTLVGRCGEAIENLEMAERLSPRDPIIWASRVVHALACLLTGDAANAANWARKTLQASARNSGYWPHAVLAAALANLGRLDEARAALAQALSERPGLSLAYIRETLPTKPPGDLGPYLDGLAGAGLPE